MMWFGWLAIGLVIGFWLGWCDAYDNYGDGP